jgi:hypothetical protein
MDLWEKVGEDCADVEFLAIAFAGWCGFAAIVVWLVLKPASEVSV